MQRLLYNFLSRTLYNLKNVAAMKFTHALQLIFVRPLFVHSFDYIDVKYQSLKFSRSELQPDYR